MFANAMEKGTETNFFFDEFEVDSLKRKLLKSGQGVHLKPKTFDLLLTLVEHHGEVLSKNDLFNLVWENQFVEENNLTVHIAALRKALGETKNNTRFIITVPGRGYRFVGELNTPAENETALESRKTERFGIAESENKVVSTELLNAQAISKNGQQLFKPATNEIILYPLNSSAGLTPTVKTSGLFKISKGHLTAILVGLAILLAAFAVFIYFSGNKKTIDSVAVLPFVNVGADPKTEYLSDGITESLINNLSQSPNLKVIARSSVFRYKVSEADSLQLDVRKIAGELGVQAVLTGRVEQRGEDLMISIELVDARDNTTIWGEHYNRKFADVFAVQEELARDISGKLRVKLSGVSQREVARRDTDNIKAFENYMMGRAYIHRRTREDLLIAERYYEQAIKEDQNYALAYTGLAEAFGNLGVRGYISPVEGRQKLETAARKAVALDDNLAEAHVMLGYYFMGFVPYNLAEGDRELRRAIELSPSLAIAHLYLSLSLLRQGKLDEGLVEMQKARELDPFSAIIARQVALYYYLKRDQTRALEILRQADEIGPPFTTTAENGIYVQSRIFEETLAKLAKEKQQRKDDPILIAGTGMIYAAQGKRREAIAVINELKNLSGTDFGHAQWIAKIHLLLGEKDEALTWLENGVETGTIGAFYKDEPLWDSLRADPRFAGLLRKMDILQ
ncbi:MAG: FlgO family outer membrane protein [Actinomycetota bacterium]